MLNFARSAVATLLGTPGKADWRSCQSSEADEEVTTQAFQRAFQAYDFTL
jgi:hypothetical protein